MAVLQIQKDAGKWWKMINKKTAHMDVDVAY